MPQVIPGWPPEALAWVASRVMDTGTWNCSRSILTLPGSWTFLLLGCQRKSHAKWAPRAAVGGGSRTLLGVQHGGVVNREKTEASGRGRLTEQNLGH